MNAPSRKDAGRDRAPQATFRPAGRRACAALVFLWIAAACPVLAQPPPAGSDAVPEAAAPESPGRAAMDALRRAMFQALLRAGQAAPADREAVIAHYPVRLEDINGDGAPEYFMTGPCGLVCECRVFARTPDGGVRLLLSAPCMEEGLSVLDERDPNGWKTLMAPIASYGTGGIKRFYAMDGGVYREVRKECYAFEGPDRERLVGRTCP